MAIDSNGYIDDVVKFNYLKSFLKGQALFAVEGLSLAAENYKEAVFFLEKVTKIIKKQCFFWKKLRKL